MDARKAVWDLFIQRMQALNISEIEIKKKSTSEIQALLQDINFNAADRAHVIAEFENIAFIAQRVPKPSSKYSTESRATGAASTPEAKRMAWNKFNMKMQELGISTNVTKIIITEFKDLMKALEWDLQALSELEESLVDEAPNPLLRVPKPSSKNGFGNRMSSDDITQTKELPPTNLFPIDFQPSLPAHQSLIDLNIPDHDAVVEWCMRQVEDMRDSAKKYSLTDDEVLSVVLYTYDLGLAHNREENIYFKLNQCLRSQAEVIVKWRDYLWYLLNAMRKLPKFKGEVYRGINANLPMEAYKKGKQVRWGAFTSTSILKSVAETFMTAKHYDAPPYLFVIEVSGGCVISEFSAVPDEAEVLLPPECSFKVAHLMDFSQPTILVMHQAFDTDVTTNLKPYIVPTKQAPLTISPNIEPPNTPTVPPVPAPSILPLPDPPATSDTSINKKSSVPPTVKDGNSFLQGKMVPLTLDESNLNEFVQKQSEFPAMLAAAPKSIILLSNLCLLCITTGDFTIPWLHGNMTKHLTPNQFHGSLLQIVNKGLSNLAMGSKSMSEIESKVRLIPKAIQSIVTVVLRAPVELMQKELPALLSDIACVTTACLNLARDIEAQSEFIVELVNECGQAITFCRSTIDSGEFARCGITEAESPKIVGQLVESLKHMSFFRKQWLMLVRFFNSLVNVCQVELEEPMAQFVHTVEASLQKKAISGGKLSKLQQKLRERASTIAAVCVHVDMIAEMYLTTSREILEIPLLLFENLLSITDRAEAITKQNEIQIKCETAVVADKFTNPKEITANFKKLFAALVKTK